MHHQLIQLQLSHWLDHSLYSYQWWLLVILCVVSWAIWWRTVDRRRLVDIILVGALCLIITTVLDGLGSELMIWSYHIQITPTFGRFIPVDFAALPITNMWLFQYFKAWKSYFTAVCLTSMMFAFVLESFMTWIGIYHPMHWKHIYSLPIYIAIFVGTRWVVEKIDGLAQSAT